MPVPKYQRPLDAAILDQLRKAAERLGADATEIRAVPASEMYAALEALGADRHLLAIVGSWKDTLEDDQVLDMLQLWNVHGRLDFDELWASTRRPARAPRRGRRRHARRAK